MRKATADDFPRLLEMGERMHAESPRHGRTLFSAERLLSMLQSLESSEGGFLWVAERDGKIVGVMLGFAGSHWCSDDIVASELALYVEPEYRGSMCGRRLIGKFLDWASVERGAILIEASVSTTISAKRTADLYEHAGMRMCGYLLEA